MSPNKQDFIWLAEYADGSYLSEFNLENGTENSFNSIKKENLIRFGLIGHGMKLYYDMWGGQFNLIGTRVDFVLKEEDKEYPLTYNNELYNKIISYKDAHAEIDFKGYELDSVITKYNFGYKKFLGFENLSITSQIVFSVPYKNPSYFNFRFVCNRDFKGDLLILNMGSIKESLPCNFIKDVSYELNWVMK
jgi:hypothetical protein